MTGQDIPTANVGGWTFNVHHKLNIQAGILHKGDGSNMLLTDSPLQFSPLVGSRDQSRSIDCRTCHENQGISTKLLHPTALTVSNDGTIYIGDLNIIWIYQPATGLAKPVLELTEQFMHKYYLTTDPVDGRLYITDNARRQIIRLTKIDSIENLRENYEIVVGDGQFCTPDVLNNVTCGDEQLAKDVSLSYPKGLTIDRYGTMYFIDGQRIRKLSIDTSRVTHLAGSFEYQFDYQRQLSCNRTYALDQVRIRDSIKGGLK
jgi:teneurin